MDEFAVASYSEYAKVMKQLYGEYTESGSLIVFRGQTFEHRLPDGRLALIPSAFRSPPPALKPTGLMPAVTRYLELYLKTADESTRRVFRDEFGSRFRTFIDAYDEPSPVSALFHVSELTDLPAIYAAFLNHEFWAAVAQHYGLPTGLLDITTDPDVALWFALRKYTRRAGGRCVDYKSTGGAGYVYALRVIANPRHVIPLSTQNGGSAHNRLPCCPRRQPSRRRRSRQLDAQRDRAVVAAPAGGCQVNLSQAIHQVTRRVFASGKPPLLLNTRFPEVREPEVLAEDAVWRG